MKRFDFVGGWFVRLGRKWFGLVAEFPFVYSCPVICGGTDATSSQGTYISVGDASSPNTYTEIAEVKSIGGPNEDSEELDATHLRSTGGYREFLQSFKDAGELPCNCNFIPANATHQTVRTLYQSGAVRGWKITYPDGSYDEFVGYVKAVGRTAAVGSILEGSFTIRISGQVDLTAAP
jgi:predicted secreted protein